jgi:hypothetical protein
VLAIYESAQTHQPISIREFLGDNVTLNSA